LKSARSGALAGTVPQFTGNPNGASRFTVTAAGSHRLLAGGLLIAEKRYGTISSTEAHELIASATTNLGGSVHA